MKGALFLLNLIYFLGSLNSLEAQDDYVMFEVISEAQFSRLMNSSRTVEQRLLDGGSQAFFLESGLVLVDVEGIEYQQFSSVENFEKNEQTLEKDRWLETINVNGDFLSRIEENPIFSDFISECECKTYLAELSSYSIDQVLENVNSIASKIGSCVMVFQGDGKWMIGDVGSSRGLVPIVMVENEVYSPVDTIVSMIEIMSMGKRLTSNEIQNIIFGQH